MVDLVPARELVANNFKVLGIDHRLQERFAKVQSVILQWVLEAERQCRGRAEGSDLSALNTALRWERLAPSIFLRPPRRGNGSIAVGGRIDRFLAGDYEVLVAEYLRDLLRNHRRQVHFVDIQGSANALRERTLRKILDNRDWSRAVRALSSNGLGVDVHVPSLSYHQVRRTDGPCFWRNVRWRATFRLPPLGVLSGWLA